MSRGATAEDRSRQAEMDAARAREIAEEQAARSENAELPSMTKAEAMAVSAKMVREYVRAVALEPAIRRLFKIGMGVERFEVATMMGNIIEVPASASTQVKALTEIINIGVPGQIGLVDGDGEVLPGVLALGPMQLDAARQAAHGDRYIAAGPSPLDNALRSMEERIADGEFETVEVEEGIGHEKQSDDVPPAPIAPINERNRLEQEILAKRRARKTGAKK